MSFFSKVVMGAAVVGVAAVASKVGVAGVALAGAGVAAKAAWDYSMAGSKAQARREWALKQMDNEIVQAKNNMKELAKIEQEGIRKANEIMAKHRKEINDSLAIQAALRKLVVLHPGMDFAIMHVRSRNIVSIEEMADKVIVAYLTNDHGVEETIYMEIMHDGEYHMYDSYDYNTGADEHMYN